MNIFSQISEVQKKHASISETDRQELKKIYKDDEIVDIESQSAFINSEMAFTDTVAFKKYLWELADKYDVCLEPTLALIDKKGQLDRYADNTVGIYRLKQLVIENEDHYIEQLKSIYGVFVGYECGVALIVQRNNSTANIFLCVTNYKTDNDPTTKKKLEVAMDMAVCGNFPGTLLEKVDERADIFKAINDAKSVQIITNVASERSDKFVAQSIERMIDGCIPRGNDTYTLILLSRAVSNSEIGERRKEYSDAYTRLSPFASYSRNCTSADSIGISRDANVGLSFVLAVGSNAGTNESVSNSVGVTLTYSNYYVQQILDRLKKQIERFDACSSLGMWEFAGYVFATGENAVPLSQNAVNIYRALEQGKESYVEDCVISSFYDRTQIDCIVKSIKCLHHPQFILKDINNELPTPIAPTTYLSGEEIALALNLPLKSVAGIPVIRCARFGRNVISTKDTYNKDILIGNVYHMHHKEDAEVFLCKKDLTAHTFITGSTGAGKSNAIYHILNEACNKNVKYMVVEPAKGEYKNIFANATGNTKANVYGTNPNKMNLIRINPFRFPYNEIHIYEHMGRLVEIFNACWPMYAAMPAVLKKAIENAYISAGWDLKKSSNKYMQYGMPIYPTFSDVAFEVRKYIDESEYSEENKGNYKGSLLTRLDSLTDGINGLIFSADDLSDEELFDENVIVDLSNVGTHDTQALIMGMLVLKLQEYRSSKGKKNADLEHITVLEEAHNLLKRTSTEISDESSNITGAAVERIANAIAEMRTYGEGFIIADQAPGLLDMSVIRNTNTKIILGLPDYDDRTLVGKAANLNEDQIAELAKLPTGVAAVFQSGWLEPVLCQFPHYSDSQKDYCTLKDLHSVDIATVDELVDMFLFTEPREKLDNLDHEAFYRYIVLSELPSPAKIAMLKYEKNKENGYYVEALYAMFAYEIPSLDWKNTDDSTKIEKLGWVIQNHLSRQLSADSLLTLTYIYLAENYKHTKTHGDEFAEVSNRITKNRDKHGLI